MTGARTSTLLQRLPFLPAADAYASENGGRIFYPDVTLPTACQIAEDARWRARHTPTGMHPGVALESVSEVENDKCHVIYLYVDERGHDRK